MLRRTSPRPRLDWADRAILAALIRCLPTRLRMHRLVTPGTVLQMTKRAGIGHWHAHEGRHTAVSIMSSNGVPLQDISDTVGHKSTHVTETVYRQRRRPVAEAVFTRLSSA